MKNVKTNRIELKYSGSPVTYEGIRQENGNKIVYNIIHPCKMQEYSTSFIY